MTQTDVRLQRVVEQVEKNTQTDFVKIGNSARLFHGRGQCFEGLNHCVVDYFSPVVLITLFAEESLTWVTQLVDALVEQIHGAGLSCECVVVQSRYQERAPFTVHFGQLPEVVFARRGEQVFKLSFTQQNVGFFLDIEPARQWLENRVAGQRVLNLFSYTCAFSVVAKSAGASSVVNIDLSRRSLSVGQDNHRINEIELQGVSFLPHDIFKSWGKLKKHGPYDTVIIDPPSFQKGSFIAEKDYAKVLRRMTSLVAEGGVVLACLNSPEVSLDQFKAQLSQELDEFDWQADLPENPFFPESRNGHGLKMVVFKRRD